MSALSGRKILHLIGKTAKFVNASFTGLVYESASDALTAAGNSQATGLQLTAELNRITTCAAGAGVNLPASAPGLTIIVINSGANPVTVYPLIGATDTIDGNSATTGVIQMVGSTCLYVCTVAGTWVTEGLGTGYSGSLQTFSYADALSANSGGVQSGATPITTMIARFTTVGGAGYSALLPAAAPGLNITVINATATSMNVFPAGSDAINSLSNSAGFALQANTVCEFFTTVAGKWHTVLSPGTSTGTGAAVFANSPAIVGPTPVAVGASATASGASGTYLLNTAAGSTLTLPAATGTGNKYKVIVTTTTTSAAHKILAASVSDFMNGIVTGENSGTAKCFASAAATNHSLQMPFSGTQPSGGFIGDWFEITDVATNLWSVSGMYQAGTTPTTPFSSATS